MASGLGTLLWTGAAVGAAAMAFTSGGWVGGLLWGAGALFSAMKAWGSHKQNQAEDQMQEARAYQVSRAQARERQVEYDNGMGRGDGRSWVQASQSQGVHAGRG